ncbi:hypothetical protein GALL_427850 [mine drainage metagenome]|uniref:Uncharacterized protein n=1 Tax=mine drainage metagenome TaxID=410659 RepID=A0A1J5PXB7_9ZZZZ
MLCDDLQKVLPRQVVATFQVDDLHFAPGADEPRDVVQRDVIAGFRVVETTARIALNQQRLVSFGHDAPHLLQCREV